MKLSLDLTPAELDLVLLALDELLQQVSADQQPDVQRVANRLRVVAGLPTDPLIEYGRD